jgi:uncharacterized membrane protein YgcG
MSSSATSSISSSTTTPSILAAPVSEKLTKSNHPLWHAQVVPPIHVAQLEDFLTGNEKQPEKDITVTIDKKSVKQRNPAYTAWMARDQTVLGYLLSSLTRETLMHVSWCTSSAQAWHMPAHLYSSQSQARTVNMRIVLTTTEKLHLSVSDYYAKTYELAATGAPLCDDEFIAYILAGLNEDYNPVFTGVVVRTDPITPSALYTQLLSFDQHTSQQAHASFSGSSSAMAASRGHGSSGGRGYGGSDWGRGSGRSSRSGSSNMDSRNSRSGTSRPQCQVCLKIGHTTNNCWHHFEEDYMPEQRTDVATSSSGADHPWYTNSGVTDHIIGDLNRCLAMHDPYTGTD